MLTSLGKRQLKILQRVSPLFQDWVPFPITLHFKIWMSTKY